VPGRIREEDLAAVRERTDIVKVISGYLSLKKAGADRMVGLCPFHTEKTPSFSVSPSKQMYYCFGCGEGGDTIKFLREVEHLEFAEVVERLAKEAGITVRYEGDTPAERRAASRRQMLQRANEEAAALYHRTLLEEPEAAEARAYVQGRGIDQTTVEAFGIGYAPRAADFLLRRLQPSGISAEILVEAGLALRDQESGAVRDRFRGRIIFPVHDLSGRSIGIGARSVPGDREDGPKYLNSPETPIYHKGETLYNLHRAKGAITRSGEVYVVEGYTDVIALAQAGIDTAVATCGTALGEGHFRLASRFAQRMVLSFDSDEAGARAAERAFAFVEQFGVQPVVLILPEGQDPADFVTAHGAEALRTLAAEAKPLVEYMIRRSVERHDLSTIEGQSAAVADSLYLIEGLSDPVRQSEYAHMLSELAGVSEGSVVIALERKVSGRPVEVQQAIKRASAQERVEREMLRLLARDRASFDRLARLLTVDHFRSTQHRSMFATLMSTGGDVRTFVERADDDAVVRDLSALALEPIDGEPNIEYAFEVWSRLQEFVLKRRSAALRQQLQKLNPTTEPTYDELFQQLIAADGELRRLREHRDVPAELRP
jgi:DNA primase